MEEDVTYATVIFSSDGISSISSLEKKGVENTIYENEKTTLRSSPIQLVTVGLGILCIILVSVITAICIHLNAVISEHNANNSNLTRQILQLWAEKSSLERQTEELSREKDSLNWTLGVILGFDTFPVRDYCSQKVCKPCLEDWVLFRSSCYLFQQFTYHSKWRTWDGSQQECRNMGADLVVIGSQEEQEFVNNYTERYNDDNHGYWIGLSDKATATQWTWVDGSNPTVKYWMTEEPGDGGHCTLTIGNRDPLANWDKAGCSMRNRWICESKVLIKSD
ncbi:uncharacterized protein ACJ7VT_020371 [Polymixia lowei]